MFASVLYLLLISTIVLAERQLSHSLPNCTLDLAPSDVNAESAVSKLKASLNNTNSHVAKIQELFRKKYFESYTDQEFTLLQRTLLKERVPNGLKLACPLKYQKTLSKKDFYLKSFNRMNRAAIMTGHVQADERRMLKTSTKVSETEMQNEFYRVRKSLQQVMCSISDLIISQKGTLRESNTPKSLPWSSIPESRDPDRSYQQSLKYLTFVKKIVADELTLLSSIL